MTEMIGSVLTGDILHSMKYDLDMRSTIRDELDTIYRKLIQFGPYKAALPAPLQLFRGDGWQIPVIEPRQSLKIGITIRAMLRARFPKERVDTRISIGIGSILVHNDKFLVNDGEAFIISGRGLDAIPKRGGSNLMLTVSPHLESLKEFPMAINPMLTALDNLIEGWTEKQANAVINALQGTKAPPRSIELGHNNRDRVTRYTLDRAGWKVIQCIEKYYFQIFSNIKTED